MKSICHLLNNCDQMCKKTFGVTFCIEYVVVILASLTLAYCYGKIKYFGHRYNLAHKWGKCKDCGYWGIGHFIYFFILGFLFPHLLFEILLLGVLWELLETCIVQYDLLFAGELKVLDPTDYSTWFGRFTDIGFNGAGFLLGWKIRTMIE